MAGTRHVQWRPRRGSPPAQGGTQILGRVEVVVDVVVNMQLKLLQSSPIDSGRCLRFRSSTEC